MTTTEQSDAASPGADEESSWQSWTPLTTTDEVEVWIDQHNRDLAQRLGAANTAGYGVCFLLGHGGEIFLHTAEDAILLDVTPEAGWAAPVITAATGIAAPRAQIWVLPDDRLTQLLLGLSSLIASSRMVVSHRYRKH